MNLGDEVDLEDYVSRPDKISAAEVRWYMLISLAIPAIVMAVGSKSFSITICDVIPRIVTVIRQLF